MAAARRCGRRAAFNDIITDHLTAIVMIVLKLTGRRAVVSVLHSVTCFPVFTKAILFV